MGPTKFLTRPVDGDSIAHWPGKAIPDLFALTADKRPDATALVDAQRRLTFRELRDAVERAAAGLRLRGIGAGDVVAYQLPNWWEAAVIFLASARVGAIVNPLLPMFREREIGFALRESEVRALVIPGRLRGCDHRQLLASLAGEHPQLEHVFVCRDDAPPPMRPLTELFAAGTAAAEPVDPESILLLMYTSGSTAAPKGVLHTHNTLAAEILSLARVHQITPDDRALMPSPVTHISGVIHAILTPAILGTTAVLMERWDPRQALELIEREGITYMAGAPTFLQELISHPQIGDFDTRSLRLFSCGGANVTPELIRTARARLPTCVAKRVYGSTEFPTISTTGDDDALTHGAATEGRAIAPVNLRIADEAGRPLPPGREGEVQARGPECFVGYTDAALTRESFTADGWFRTGDLGTLDADGYLRITGRIKEIIVRKGEKISVREVEDLLVQCPGIAEAAVVPLADAATGERACAVVCLQPGASLTLADLNRFLTERGLARQKHPEQLEIVTQLPHTESGKVHKPQLRALLERQGRDRGERCD